MSDHLATAAKEVAQVCSDLVEILRADVGNDGALTLTAVCEKETRWFTYDDRGLIERFPERDPKLPLAQRLGETRDWRVLSYRPGRRVVVLVHQGERVNVLKGHKKSRSSRAAVFQRVAEDASGRGAFRVPRLVQHDAASEALVFEYLSVREVDLGPESVPLYGRLGELLRVFQADESANDLKHFGIRDEMEVIDRWKVKALQVIGALPAGWEEAHGRLLRCAERLPEPQWGLCHRDLHDRQVHVEGTTLALMDFDLLCRADVALDPGNLCAHLRWRAAQGLHGADVASAAALERAFFAGLARSGEPGFETRLAFYRASAFLRLALVYRFRPRWSERVTELVSWAGAALDDLSK